jgi:hypothetical protein
MRLWIKMVSRQIKEDKTISSPTKHFHKKLSNNSSSLKESSKYIKQVRIRNLITPTNICIYASKKMKRDSHSKPKP